jgi:hypothetical protein
MPTKVVWLVTETAYGKVWGWRHFLHQHEAEETARRWRSQNVGVVTVEHVALQDQDAGGVRPNSSSFVQTRTN